jgi:spermidine synthase
MGGTIPMLTQALARSLDDATGTHALVYGFNTTGAFAGALAAGFWIVPALGLAGALVAMAVVNLAAGAIFVALGRRASAAPPLPPPEADVRVEGFAAFAGAAFLTGFAMMTLQTVLIRMGGLSFGSSEFTFAMVVAVFVLCIALGSFAVSWLPRIPPGLVVVAFWAMVILLVLLYQPLQDSPYWAHRLRVRFSDLPSSFYPYHAAGFAGVLAVIGLPVALSGAALPLFFHHLRREVGQLGDVAGRLYSWNTLGSVVGALLGGYALLFWLDLHHVFRLGIAALAVAGALITVRVLGLGRLGVAVSLAAFLAAVASLPAWSPNRLASGLFRKRLPLEQTFAGPEALFASLISKHRIPFYDDDPNTSVAVFGSPPDAIIVNGKSDSSLAGDRTTTCLAALVPALLAERTERAFVVGYGTGVTAGELAVLPPMREVLVAEISTGVMEAAPLFDYGNQQASTLETLRIVRGDAFRALLRSQGRFDVITSEPSNPWVTGVEMLYSREFLEAARDHLAPGGVFGQWFHTYETDDATVALVLRTYASVFDHVAVWHLTGYDHLLLGVRDAESALDIERIVTRAGTPAFAAGLRRCKIESPPALFAHELLPLGVLHAAIPPGELHTLHHPRLSHLAARAFFTGGVGQLPATATPEATEIGLRNSLIQRYAAFLGGPISDSTHAKIVGETCKYLPRQCVTLLAHWQHEMPDSPLREKLQAEILTQPHFAGMTREQTVDPVARLYGDGPIATDGAADPVQAAIEASELYRAHFHHAIPFSREALAAAWDRCESDAERSDRCRAARAQVEQELGTLSSQRFEP